MAKRFFTIMLIPDRSTQMKRLVFSHSLLKVAGGVAAGLLVTAIGITAGFFHYRSLHLDDSTMRQENQRYRYEIEQIRSKVSSIETYLERVRSFDKKLRTITNLEDSERHIALGPIEGEAKVENGVQVAALSPDFRVPELGGSTSSKKALEKFSSLQHSLEQIELEAAERESSLGDLESKLKNMKTLLQFTPAIWPAVGWVTSNFGFRISPFSGSKAMHEGIDVAARPGTPIHSPADGIVTFVGTLGNYGKTIVVNHGYGTVTRYGHLSDVYVKLGANVKRGDKLAAIGNTGRSTGPHLHYEVVVDGIPRDPRKYILN